MIVDPPKGEVVPLRFQPQDTRITMNEVMCYQVAQIKDGLQLICSVPGGLHMAMPVTMDLQLDDLVSLCDRMAFAMWGFHGQYGVFGVRVPIKELEAADVPIDE